MELTLACAAASVEMLPILKSIVNNHIKISAKKFLPPTNRLLALSKLLLRIRPNHDIFGSRHSHCSVYEGDPCSDLEYLK
jgi:hypothetical protein